MVNFDQKTGLLQFLESMACKEPDSREKTYRLNEIVEWGFLNETMKLTRRNKYE